LTFLVFCLLTNIIVTSMLILGGAAVVNGLTGGSNMMVKRLTKSDVSRDALCSVFSDWCLLP
jgi:hypothetical protein